MSYQEFELPNNRKLVIEYDSHAENPRTFCDSQFDFHVIRGSKHTHLADVVDDFDISTSDEHLEMVKKDNNVAHAEKIYGYSKGGLTLSRTPFSCAWDSGVFGILTINKEKVREIHGVKRVTKKLIEQLKTYIDSELETFNQWLNGDCYGFRVVNTITDEEEDSCWGFYGDDIEKNGILDHLSKEDREYVLELV